MECFYQETDYLFLLDNAIDVKDLSCEFTLDYNDVFLENIKLKTLKSQLHLASFTYDVKSKDHSNVLYQLDSIQGNLHLSDVIHFLSGSHFYGHCPSIFC